MNIHVCFYYFDKFSEPLACVGGEKSDLNGEYNMILL